MRKLAPGLFAVATVFTAVASVLAPSAVAAGPTAAQLLAKLTSCRQISNGKYATDSGGAKTVPVCGKTGAVWYKADMDIDCDGQPTPRCAKNTDPWFQPETAFQDSKGEHLVADRLPFTVVPSPSAIFDYRKHGIQGGGVVAVIFNNRVEYTVVGDTGPADIIGEASYAAAANLGINPNPETGGTAGPVHHLCFKGSKVSPIEDHGKAVSTGAALARKFLNEN